MASVLDRFRLLVAGGETGGEESAPDGDPLALAGPAAPAPRPPPDLPAAFSKEIDEARKYRRVDEDMWDLCLRFVEGFQRLLTSTGNTVAARFQVGLAGDIVHRKSSDHQFNILLTPWRFMLSRLAIVYPSMGVLPASNSVEDIGKSEASEQALTYYWWQEDVRKLATAWTRWLTLTGNVGLWNVYNPGDGLTHMKVVSPYDILHEPGALDPDDADWTAVRTLYKRDVLKEAYPKHTRAIEEATPVGQKPTSRGPKDRIEVWDVYWRAGWHGVLCGDTWLWGTDEGEGWTPKGGEIPVQHIRYTVIPDRLYGLGMIHAAIDPVRVFKEKNDQIVDAVRVAASPKVLIPDSANVPSTAFKVVGFEKIPVSGLGANPSYMQANPIPEAAFRDVARIESLIMDILGVHSTSLGKTAQNVESGAHVEVLTQNDASQLQTTQEDIASAVREHARVALVHMKAYYTEERSLRMYDDEGEFVFGQIQATNLVDAPEVFLEADSLFRDGVVERRRKALALVDAGVLTPMEAADEIALGTRSKRLLDRVSALSHANEMLRGVIQGAAIQVYATDDLDAFERVFGGAMRNSKVFYALPPDAQARVAAAYAQIVQMKLGPAGVTADQEQVGALRAAANAPGPPGAPGPRPMPAGVRSALPATTSGMARFPRPEATQEAANRTPTSTG